MKTSKVTKNQSKVRILLRELRKRHCDNFRVIGGSVWYPLRKS